MVRLLRGLVGEQPPARLPDGLRVYAVGDVHGRADLLATMEQRIVADRARRGDAAETLVVFVGDYIDRGPSSRAVVERLRGGTFAGCPARFLLGNHEAVLLQFLVDPLAASDWLDYGGRDTLASYGVAAGAATTADELLSLAADLAEAIPTTHLDFLRGLEVCVERGGFLFVHAGIRPGVRLARQRRRDLLFIREPFLGTTRRLSHRVVHGHTVSEEVAILPHRIGIDTGAYRTGRLSAVVIEGEAVEVLA